MKEYNVKSIRNDFKKQGIFYTEKENAELLKKYVDIETDEVYDPTCGRGNLLSVFDDEVKKYGQELNADELENAKILLKNFEGVAGDTLQEDGFKGKKFKVILGNPPFSVKYEQTDNIKNDERFKDLPCLAPPSRADYMFNFHILHHLKDDGVAVVLNFPGILYRGNKEKILRKYLIDNNYIDKIIQVPGNTFTDTKIQTVILVYKKNKSTTDIEFADLELKKTKVIKQEEIIKKDYSLSVQQYVYDETPKEKIDIVALEKQIYEMKMKRRKLEDELDNFIIELKQELNI